MNPAGTKTNRIERQARTFCAVKADATGDIPKRLEVLQIGVWRTAYHGDFMITPDDLQEYINNFNAAVGLPGEGVEGAPIDYGHESWDKAAGWIKSLTIEEDSLIATVEWTPKGAQMIRDGEFKFFSPEFYPKGRGGWFDNENPEYIVENVLVGGGLTNIPLFKGLSPVTASSPVRASADGRPGKNVIYISASEVKKEPEAMNLADLRTKKLEELNEAEKAFVTEHKSELTADEQKAFGLESAANPAQDAPADPGTTQTPKEGDQPVSTTPAATEGVPAAVAASLRSGESVVVKASTLKHLEDTASQYQTEKATAFVKAHAARGAIKADQIAGWTDRLVKADAQTREDLEAALNGLPDNPVMASTQGADDKKSGDATAVVDELKTKTLAKVQASKEAGRTITYGQAQADLLREDTDLAQRVEAARKVQ